VTTTRAPLPDPDDSNNGSAANADGPPDNPETKQVDLSPGAPVSFDVPPNTNLVVNVVGKQGGGCLSSLFSGCGCLVIGFIALAVVAAVIGFYTR
jgi:hypothetical protein